MHSKWCSLCVLFFERWGLQFSNRVLHICLGLFAIVKASWWVQSAVTLHSQEMGHRASKLYQFIQNWRGFLLGGSTKLRFWQKSSVLLQWTTWTKLQKLVISLKLHHSESHLQILAPIDFYHKRNSQREANQFWCCRRGKNPRWSYGKPKSRTLKRRSQTQKGIET